MTQKEISDMEYELHTLAKKVNMYANKIRANMWTIKDTVEVSELEKRATRFSIAADIILEDLPYFTTKPDNAE